MANPLANRVPQEYAIGRAHRFDAEDTSYRGRGIQPSFQIQGFGMVSLEPVSLSMANGALTSGQSVVLTGTQKLSTAAALALQQFEQGSIIFTHVSVSAPANALCGHPAMSVTSDQGTLPAGQLASGQSYTGLAITVSVPVYATGAVVAGTVSVSGQAIVTGSVLGN
jgi:hypothetical protein